MSVVACPVLIVASWPTYRFLRRQVSWFSIPISLKLSTDFTIHTVKGFSIVNKAEVDAFLEFSSFFYDPTDVGNLISGSSAFSKSSLNIWKFTVHVLLKPHLENFEVHMKGMNSMSPKTCILRNLYASQEATVRTGHGTTDWFQIGKGVRQGSILSPCLFNFYDVPCRVHHEKYWVGWSTS